MSLPVNKTVVVGMSGGVDSSVAALLLKQEGYNVIGLYMNNWDEIDDNGVCQAQAEYEDVLRVSDQIGIRCYSFNFSENYYQNVFERFLDEYERGFTPNPDILCNKEIKFKVLFDKAKELGADFLATGHYCQIGKSKGSFQLLKGKDSGKDQSYFLYAIDPRVLCQTLFPIGSMDKSDVRAIAEEYGLVTAKKKDSTGICFIGKRHFRSFLSQYIHAKKGVIKDLEGNCVGEHYGSCYYTIGQRKGLEIGGPGDAWFVAGKDAEKNILYVVQGKDHPALFTDELTATELHWILPDYPTFPLRCKAKIRYRQKEDPCVIQSHKDGRIFVTFDVPQRAVTPRQSIVFYDGDICLGGALIEKPGLNFHERKESLHFKENVG